MSDTIVRDRWSRPLIVPPEGGKPVAYTRVSTLAKALDDLNQLMMWKQRKTAEGLLRRPDLLTRLSGAIANGDPDTDWPTKKDLNRICSEAVEAAGASKGSSAGTGFHALTEAIDRGEDPQYVGADDRARLDAYRKATEGYTPLAAETFVVCDELRAAGSFDRLWLCPDGAVRVGDLKGLAVDTPIATPTGWSTMGDLEVGDEVFGPDGKPTSVIAKSDVKHIDCYRVRFDDGTSLVCDAEHLWETWARRDGNDRAVRSVGDIAATIRTPQGQAHHRIPVTEPLVLPEADLSLDPYVLGVWLGDCKRTSGEFTTAADDTFIPAAVRERGYVVSDCKAPKPSVRCYNIRGLRKDLRALGILGEKQVPKAYLRGSIDQRLDLLRGLMDTDGSYNIARKRVVFSVVDDWLADAVHDLATSLGERAHRTSAQGHGFGKDVTVHVVEWRPGRFNPFTMPRKADKVTVGGSRATRAYRRVIVAVEATSRVPTACVAVDSDSHLFLAGREMVATHNTGKSEPQYPLATAMQLAIYANGSRYDPATGEREPLHEDLDLSTGLLVHMPAVGGCTVYPLDIGKGWMAAVTASVVHGDIRRWKPEDLIRGEVA